jgi:Leucine-rich repeat (LRR) protein
MDAFLKTLARFVIIQYFIKWNSQAFKKSNHQNEWEPNLIEKTILYLNNRGIWINIHESTFAGLTKLKELYLSLNQSFSGLLDPSTFTGLTNLTILDLDNNKLIGQLDPSIFIELASLNELYLQNNQLSGQLDASTFIGLRSLKFVDLGYNQFSGLWLNYFFYNLDLYSLCYVMLLILFVRTKYADCSQQNLWFESE